MITEHSSSKRILDESIFERVKIPRRGPFYIPEPYNVRAVRVTNEDDGLINPVGYSYWPNVQVNNTYLNVFIGTNNGVKLFRINKHDLIQSEMRNHKLPFHTGEGWFWSREEDWLYFYESWGRTLRKYNVSTDEIKDIFTVDEDYYIWQLHASFDEDVFSFTLRKKPDLVICPAVWMNGKLRKFDLHPGYDECQIYKSGRYLLVKEQDGRVNRILNLEKSEEIIITLESGSLGHSDNGLDYSVGEDRITEPGGVFRKANLSFDSHIIYHMDWTTMSRHVSHCNAPSDFALVSCDFPDNLPRAKELVLITLDGSLICHSICPTFNTGMEYDDLPKANLSYDGKYAAWTARVNGRRDLFIVEIPEINSIPEYKPPKEETNIMPEYDKFVFDEIRRIGQAWFDANHESWMDNLTHDQKQFIFEKIGEMSWRRLMDGKSVHTILTEIGVDPADYGEPNPNPKPPISDLMLYPRYGMSIASLIVNTKCNIEETVKRFVDAGVNSTRINLLSALWPDVDCLPFFRLSNGKWDLFDWNEQYFERLAEVKERMNSSGIVIQWTNYELYSWSKRKPGPQQDGTPWRNNINGIHWDETDNTFNVLPNDGWSDDWFKKVCPLLDLHTNPFEVGNEFPEKALHERVQDLVIDIVPDAMVQINRNEDTPGQYENMKIGERYEFLALHGNRLKKIEDLEIVYPREPKYKTFQQFIDNCPHEKERVIFSSDGARTSSDPTDTYDWDDLGEFFDHMIDLGYNIEHQSRAKMTPAPNHHMIEVDWFLERVKK